jgi:teichoic acid transport system permease protein
MVHMEQHGGSDTLNAPGSAAELAREHGLNRLGQRPRIGAYLRSVWLRRQFIGTLAWSNAYVQNRNTFMGQAWLIINPLMWAAVYYLVFGVGLKTGEGVENFVAFLVVGIFMFRHMQACVMGGSKSITGNVSLIRSLHFPRAVLPIATVLTELILLIPALVLLFLIVGISGIFVANESPSVTWFLVPAGVAVMSLFTTGAALIMARLVVESRDIGNLIPFVMRAAFYTSGIFFSIKDRFDGTVGMIMSSQPFAVYLEIFRGSLLQSVAVEGRTWILGAGWGILFLVCGFIYFWLGEERYGRD